MKLKNVYIILLLLIILNCKTADKKKNTNSKNNNNGNKIELTGIVKKITVGPPGTFSQYTYFILDTNDKSDSLIKKYDFTNILFNKETRDSREFDKYVNKKVKITGKEIIGYIGWRKKTKRGILVEKIKILK